MPTVSMADTGKTNGDLVAPIQEKEREPKTEPSNNDRRHLSDQETPAPPHSKPGARGGKPVAEAGPGRCLGLAAAFGPD